jgi:hypothetical protein
LFLVRKGSINAIGRGGAWFAAGDHAHAGSAPEQPARHSSRIVTAHTTR